MVMYDITIDYTTGSIYGQEQLHGEPLGVVTSSIVTVRANLFLLKEHHDTFKDVKRKAEIPKLILYTDTGPLEVSPVWLDSYAELHVARIAIAGKDTSLEF